METVAIIFGFLLLNVILAYVPIILVVNYNLRPRPKKTLYEQYIYGDEDGNEISTAEFIALMDEEWKDKKRAPLL